MVVTFSFLLENQWNARIKLYKQVTGHFFQMMSEMGEAGT